MKRFPGALFLILGTALVGVAVTVADGGHVGIARSCVPEVYAHERPGPADDGVGVVEGAKRTDAVVHAYCLGDGTVYHYHASVRSGGTGHGGMLGRSDCQDDRQVFRSGAGHNCVCGYSLHGIFIQLLMCGDTHHTHHFLGIVIGPGEHLRDPFLCRQYNGQAIGPAVLKECMLEIRFGIRIQQAGPLGPFGNLGIILGIGQWLCQRVGYFRHQVNASHWIVSLNIGDQGFPGNPRNRVGRK